MRRKNIKALLFDLDNTIYAYEPAHKAAYADVIQYLAKATGFSIDILHEAWGKARASIHRELQQLGSSHSRLLYVQRTLESCGCFRVDWALQGEAVYWNTFLKKMQLEPGVTKILDSIRQSNHLCGIVTDLTAAIQMQKLVHLGFHSDFKALVTSEEAGHEKPHPWPFQLCLQKLGVKNDQAIMIGDSESKDILGALGAGLAFAIHLNPKAQAGWNGQVLSVPELDHPLLTELIENFYGR